MPILARPISTVPGKGATPLDRQAVAVVGVVLLDRRGWVIKDNPKVRIKHNEGAALGLEVGDVVDLEGAEGVSLDRHKVKDSNKDSSQLRLRGRRLQQAEARDGDAR